MPSRNGMPGATIARASAMAELGRATTTAWYPAAAAVTYGRRPSAGRARVVHGERARTHQQAPGPTANATARASEVTGTTSMPAGPGAHAVGTSA